MAAPVEWERIGNVSSLSFLGFADSDRHGRIIQLDNGNILAVWTQENTSSSGPGSDPKDDVIGRIFDPTGRSITLDFQINVGPGATALNERLPDITAIPGGGFMVVFQGFNQPFPSPDSFGIRGEIYSDTGVHQDSFTIEGQDTDSLWDPVIASTSSTSAMVVYADPAGISGTDYLYGRIVNPSTGSTGTAFQISQHSNGSLEYRNYDITVLTNGNYAVTWVDVDSGTTDDTLYVRLYNSSGVAVTSAQTVHSDDYLGNPSITALQNGRMVITWEQAQGDELRFQVMNANGTSFSNRIAVNNDAGLQIEPVVVGLEDGDFAIIWYDSIRHEVLGRRFNPNGSRDGDEFVVDSLGVGVATSIDATSLSDGRFAIATSVSTNPLGGGADELVVASIWDPRDGFNTVPGNGNVIGTVNSDTFNPLPVGGDFYAGHDGNDVFWVNASNGAGVGADFDGGDGFDTVGLFSPGSYSFTAAQFRDIEQLKFNAGSANGMRTATIDGALAEELTQVDFAQGGDQRLDRLEITVATGQNIDASGLIFTDFEQGFDVVKFFGTFGPQTITGTSVDDIFYLSFGTDALDGFTGNNTVDATLLGNVAGVDIDIRSGGTFGGPTGAFATLANFDNVVGSFGSDNLIGNADANRLIGLDGDDDITLNGGGDYVEGNAGNDTFFVNSADQNAGASIAGGTDFDIVAATVSAAASFTMDLGAFSLLSVEGVSFQQAANGGTVSTIDVDQSMLDGFVLASDLRLYGHNGQQDTFRIQMTTDGYYEADNLQFSNWESIDRVSIRGSNGIGDKVVGTAFTDLVETFSGNDVVNLSLGSDGVLTHEGQDSVEIGNQSDLVNTGADNDFIFLRDYDIMFLPMGSFDRHLINGGSETDSLYWTGFDISTTLDLTSGELSLSFDGTVLATVAEIEVFEAGSGNDTFIGDGNGQRFEGNRGNDTFQAGAGEDVLLGGSGRDMLDGGADADEMAGGSDNDTYYVDHAGDVVVEFGFADAGYDRVFVENLASYTLTDNVERLTFTDTIDHTGKGNAGNNRLDGNAGRDKFLIDEGGNDTFSGGSNQDTFDARASDTGLLLFLNNQSLNAGAVDGDMFASIEVFAGSNTQGDTMRAGDARARFQGGGGEDTLIGGNNIDFLRGDAGDDDLFGGAARDTLIGGTGNDDLHGGNDRDQFRFVEADFGQDTIHDWQDGLDVMRFFSAVATSFADFTVTGNGTNNARVTLAGDPANFIDVVGVNGSLVTIDAGDFQFY